VVENKLKIQALFIIAAALPDLVDKKIILL